MQTMQTQCRRRITNAASDQGLQSLLTEISIENAVKMKQLQETLKTRKELIQMIKMDKSTAQKKGLSFRTYLSKRF